MGNQVEIETAFLTRWFILLLILFCTTNTLAQTNPRHVRVNGYYRSDGTYVRPHYRTAPNYTNRDNFSTIGNVNPYTGKAGWIPPDNKQPYYTSSSYYYTTSNYKKQKRKLVKEQKRKSRINKRKKKPTYIDTDPLYNGINKHNTKRKRSFSLESEHQTKITSQYKTKQPGDYLGNDQLYNGSRKADSKGDVSSLKSEGFGSNQDIYSQTSTEQDVYTCSIIYNEPTFDHIRKEIGKACSGRVTVLKSVNSKYNKVKSGDVVGYMLKSSFK